MASSRPSLIVQTLYQLRSHDAGVKGVVATYVEYIVDYLTEVLAVKHNTPEEKGAKSAAALAILQDAEFIRLTAMPKSAFALNGEGLLFADELAALKKKSTAEDTGKISRAEVRAVVADQTRTDPCQHAQRFGCQRRGIGRAESSFRSSRQGARGHWHSSPR